MNENEARIGAQHMGKVQGQLHIRITVGEETLVDHDVDAVLGVWMKMIDGLPCVEARRLAPHPQVAAGLYAAVLSLAENDGLLEYAAVVSAANQNLEGRTVAEIREVVEKANRATGN